MTLAQYKALAYVFCEPIIEGLWDRLMTNTLIVSEGNNSMDIIWDVFNNTSNEELKDIVIDLADEFQFMYDAGKESTRCISVAECDDMEIGY